MTKLTELEQRLKDEPDNLGLRVLVASALHEAGRRHDSIELYRSVAIAYRDQGRTQQAIAVCHSVLAFAPDDQSCQQLLTALATVHARSSNKPPAERLTPPRLPKPPPPGPAADETSDAIPQAAIDEDSAVVRPSFGDMTPLPAPVPYHLADPVTAPVAVPAAERIDRTPPPTFAEEMARRTPIPEIAGIASAARQISASLIAASREAVNDDVSGELETRRLPRITADDLRKISGPPPAFFSGPIPIPEPISAPDDDEPTLMPSDGVARVVDEETTEPRELPTRTRPPPLAADGPLTGAFFEPVPPRNRADVLQRFRRRVVAGGTTVIRRGETGHGLVIVVHGLLELHADRSDGARIVLGAITPGEYIGEASLLTRKPAAIDVVAAVDSELMILASRDFHELTVAYSALRSELVEVAERRAREHEQRLALAVAR